MIAFFRGMEPERLAAWQDWLSQDALCLSDEEVSAPDYVRFHDLNEDGTED